MQSREAGGEAIVVVGAGLAGLACAVRLAERGLACRIVEASNRVGGRVGSDLVGGFRLDRGFQVLLTSYPETARTIELAPLRLGRYRTGALVRYKGRFYRVGDPTRHLSDALPSLLAPVGTLADKLRIPLYGHHVTAPPLPELLARRSTSAADALAAYGFSPAIRERFFRPFLGGVFLERELATSSRKLEFVFRMFATGEAALPRDGMQAIPDQLARRLPPGTVWMGTHVAGLEERALRLDDGSRVPARALVLAVEEPEFLRLTGSLRPAAACHTTTLYYAAPESPVRGPWLVLNGEGSGPINNLSAPSEVQAEYAPAGAALISVSVIGNPTGSELLEPSVRSQLRDWYGAAVDGWRHLATYAIPYGVPLQGPDALDPVSPPARLSELLFVCGDHRYVASIEGAIVSGQRAADAVAESGV